jgi:hypothetical protein
MVADQKARYGGALWPADVVVDDASGKTILESFMRDYKRDDAPKGIVLLDLEELSFEEVN